ncbi:MAG: 30S ribosome-binding factor RbfA [Planctomycetes bacterium]|nr:30S ribosome-binding factor RbfA [Planctomycetota bacterium]
MPNRRAARVAERIREDVSLFLLRDLRDPRLELVTITRVEATDDLKHATVYFSVLGDEAKRRTAERGLASARGLIRSRVAKGLGLREAPDLAFEFDPSIAKAIELSRLLDQVGAELRAKNPPTEPAEDD